MKPPLTHHPRTQRFQNRRDGAPPSGFHPKHVAPQVQLMDEGRRPLAEFAEDGTQVSPRRPHYLRLTRSRRRRCVSFELFFNFPQSRRHQRVS
jgi:hypothetical protein